MLNKTDKILITGGHLTCALAVLDGLIDSGYKNISWVGTKHSQTDAHNLSAEYQVITHRKVKFIDLKAGKLWRKVTGKTFFLAIKNLFLIPAGFFSALGLIRKEKPKLVMSFGGYLALPVVIAAKLSGKKVATHEQTLTVGLANKIIAKFADKIFISFKESAGLFPSGKVVYTGLPMRSDLFINRTHKIKFDNKHPVIYVTGGNQGSNTINWRLFKILPKLLKVANVIHQVGDSTLTKDIDEAKEAKYLLPEEIKDNYYFYANTYSIIGEIYSKSNVILSRAGANTVYEIMALGKLAVLIPIPWSSAQEQLKNAKLVAKTGLGFILEQYDEMPPEELYQALLNALNVYQNRSDFLGRPLEKARENARTQVKFNAFQIILENLIKLV